MVGQPQGHLRNLRGEFFYFYAVKLVYVDGGEGVHVQHLLAAAVGGAQNLDFELAQFAVGNDKKVAAATGGVKKGQRAQAFVKFKQAALIAFDAVKFGP